MKMRLFSRPAAPCFLRFFIGFLVLGGLCACAGVETDPTYSDKQREEIYKYGSVVSDSGGFSLLGDKEKKREDGGMGVNAYLWRASLDTISFMPIASADPFGGLITTDWHSSQTAPDERIKLNILILDRDLRADGVKVTVFRQTRDRSGNWADAAAAPNTASSLEDAILTRARQMRLAQKEMK